MHPSLSRKGVSRGLFLGDDTQERTSDTSSAQGAGESGCSARGLGGGVREGDSERECVTVSECVTVKFKALSLGEELAVSLQHDMLVAGARLTIAERLGVEGRRVTLVFAGRILADEEVVGELRGVGEEMECLSVHVVVARQ